MVVNVKDFGAIGDGQHIDSAAIQAAIDYAGLTRWQLDHTGRPGEGVSMGTAVGQLHPRWNNRLEQPGAVGSHPVVYFPAGHYLIDEPLRSISNYARLQGENHAILEQVDSRRSIIEVRFNANTIALQFNNLAFVGGRHALFINTGNSEGLLTIQDCEFHATSGFALYTDASNSTLLYITDCKFEKCRQVLRATFDQAVAERCFIRTSPHMKGPAIRNYGNLYLSDILGVGTQVADLNQEPRWIDNHGSVYCDRINVGSHNGPAFAAVIQNYARATNQYPVIPTCVSLVNSQMNGIRSDRGAIHLVQVPNLLQVSGNSGFAGMKLISVDTQLSRTGLDRLNRDYYYEYIKIIVSRNVPENTITAVDGYEKMITFLTGDLFLSGQEHRDAASNLLGYGGTAYDPGDPAWLPHSSPNQPVPQAAVRDPFGMWAARLDVHNAEIGDYISLVRALDKVVGNPGVYTFSALVRTRQAKVALSAFHKRITGFTASDSWSRIWGSFYFDGALPNTRDIWTSLGIQFRLDDPAGLVDVGSFSLVKGLQQATFVLPGQNEVLPSIQHAPIFWGFGAPTTGQWEQGDMVFNSGLHPAGIGWLCVTRGRPGVWRGF